MGDTVIKLFQWIASLWNDYLSPIVFVRGYESGVMLKMGEFKKELHTGINWKWFYPFNEAHKCNNKPETKKTDVITITTNDGVTISIGFIGRYRIVNIQKWLLDANDAASNLLDEWLMVASDHATDCDWPELKKKTTYTELKNKVNKKIEYLGVEFVVMGYSSICKSISLSNFNDKK